MRVGDDVKDGVENGVSAFELLAQTPPPIVLWASFFVALCVLLWNVIAFFLQRKKEKREKLFQAQEGFWFQEIILPFFLHPLREFVEEFSEEIRMVESGRDGNYREFLERFQRAHRRLVYRAFVLRDVDEDVYGVVERKLEELEDKVTVFCAQRDLGASVSRGGEGGMDGLELDAGVMERVFYVTWAEVSREIRSGNVNAASRV